MRVGISLLTLVPGEVGGAETSARGLCRGLAEVGTLEYTAFTPPAAPGAGEGLPEVPVPEYRLARSIPERALAMATRGGAARPAAPPLRRRSTPSTTRSRSRCRRSTSRRVVTVHDLQHLDHPELFSRAERLFRARTHEGSARTADAGDRPEPVRPPSRDRAARLPARAGARDPVGRRPRPLSAWAGGAGAVPPLPGPSVAAQEPRPPLRGVRAPPRRASRAAARADRRRPRGSAAVPPASRCADYVSGDELASLYRRTACLVFPSLYEGFGQPPLEAMASGTPVAASNIPGDRGGVRRRGGALRPDRPGGHRGGRRGRARRARSVRRRQASSVLGASPGPRRPAGTRTSTAGLT